MEVQFTTLEINKEYTQKELAILWKYKSYDAIRRGIVTPANTSLIILFVTEQKAAYATQYNDYIDGNILYMQGEAKHGNDNRLLKNLNNESDTIYLFYRVIHHSPFTFKGEVKLLEAELKNNSPSEFKFKLLVNKNI